MPDINFVNPQINNIEEKVLSIQISLNGFSFSIQSFTDPKDCLSFRHYKLKNIILFDELIRKIEQLISNDYYLQSDFKKADVVFLSQNSTLIPEEFFSTEDLKKYFEFNHNLAELDEIHYTLLPEIDAYNVFSLPNYLTNIFYNLCPNTSFHHQSSQLIKYGGSLLKKTDSCIVLGVNSTFFDIIVYENNQLILSNSFQYTNPTDFIYFFLNACTQLKLDPKNTPFFLLGDIQRDKGLITTLKTHVGELIIPDLARPSICANLGYKQAVQFYNLFLL